MKIQFRVKTQVSGLDALLIDNGTEHECHYNGPADDHNAIRKALADAMIKSDYPVEAGDTIELIDLDD